MVPIKEMTDVLKVIRETAGLKPKQWVRLKRGIFRDDLAQVRRWFFLDPRKHLLFVYCCSLLVSCVNCYIDFQVIMIWPASVWLISVSGNPAVHHILHLLLITWPSNHITQVFIPHCFHFVSWPLADFPWLFVEVFTCWLSGITCSVLCHVTWLPAQSSTVTPSESVHCILKWLYDVHLASFLLQFVPIFCVKI